MRLRSFLHELSSALVRDTPAFRGSEPCAGSHRKAEKQARGQDPRSQDRMYAAFGTKESRVVTRSSRVAARRQESVARHRRVVKAASRTER